MHLEFPSNLPSMHYPSPMQLYFSVSMGADLSLMARPLASGHKDPCKAIRWSRFESHLPLKRQKTRQKGTFVSWAYVPWKLVYFLVSCYFFLWQCWPQSRGSNCLIDRRAPWCNNRCSYFVQGKITITTPIEIRNMEQPVTLILRCFLCTDTNNCSGANKKKQQLENHRSMWYQQLKISRNRQICVNNRLKSTNRGEIATDLCNLQLLVSFFAIINATGILDALKKVSR